MKKEKEQVLDDKPRRCKLLVIFISILKKCVFQAVFALNLNMYITYQMKLQYEFVVKTKQQ